jgi:hypothetical protein
LNKPRRGALVGDPNFFGETPKRPGRRYVSSPRARPSLRGSDHDGARQIRNAPNLYGPGRVIDGRVDPSAKRGWPKPSFNSFAHPHPESPSHGGNLRVCVDEPDWNSKADGVLSILAVLAGPKAYSGGE